MSHTNRRVHLYFISAALLLCSVLFLTTRSSSTDDASSDTPSVLGPTLTAEQTLVDAKEVFKDIETRMAAQEDFLVVLRKQSCSYCQEYDTNVLTPYMASHPAIEVLQLDLDLAFDDPSTLDDFLASADIAYQGTPTTLAVVKGELANEHLLGSVHSEDFDAFVERMFHEE